MGHEVLGRGQAREARRRASGTWVPTISSTCRASIRGTSSRSTWSRRKVVWRAVSPAPFWAGAVATSTGPRLHGRHARLFHGPRRALRNDLSGSSRRARDHRKPDHLRARRHAVRRRPLRRHRRRHDLLLQGAEGRESLGLRPRRRRSGGGSHGNESDDTRGRLAEGRRAGQSPSAVASFPDTAFRRPKAASRSRETASRSRRPRRRPPRPPTRRRVVRGEQALSRALLRLPPGRRRQRSEPLPDGARSRPIQGGRREAESRARHAVVRRRFSRPRRSGRSTPSFSPATVSSDVSRTEEASRPHPPGVSNRR